MARAFWTHEGMKNWDQNDPIMGDVFVFRAFGVFDRQLTAKYGAIHSDVLAWSSPHGDAIRIKFGKPSFPGDCTVFITDPDIAMIFKLRFL